MLLPSLGNGNIKPMGDNMVLMQKELIVGNEYSSFVLLDKTECPDYRGTGYLFRHKKTDMEVFFLSTDNKECFFTYTVYTPPKDNTGVFHILEHTVLTGSRRYPVRDPFMALSRNSCNTFLNAMTSPDRTDYPAASPVKKDFDNIFAVYTDAVFDPLLRKEDFMQEGIRLSSQGGLHFEGVVFSEMQGDISSHQSVVQNSISRPLYPPTSPYAYESGGNPPDITDLTYEKFIETYRKYYVPANMTLFLYGDLDVTEKLEFLDREYLSSREKGEKAVRAEKGEDWDSPRRFYAKSSAEEGDDSASIMVSWLLGEADDPRLNTELSLLVDVLLGNPGCPLYRRITESGIGRDISSESGMSDAYRNLSFSVGFSGSKTEKAEEAEAFILSSLASIVEEGLDPTLVESSLRRMEFRIQEISDGLPEGYRIYFTRVDKGWVYGKNPSEMLQTLSLVGEIRDEIRKDPRYLEKWIERNLLENNHRLLSVVSMDDGIEAEMAKEIERKLEEHRNEWNEEEEKAYMEFEEGEDDKASLLTLPRLTLGDIPSDLPTIPRRENGNVIITELPSNGIVYMDMAFDISDYSISELEIASLLSRLLFMTDVGDKDYASFLVDLRFNTGAFSSFLDIGSDCNGEEKDYLFVRFKSLKEHFGEALDLFSSLFRYGNFSSEERIKGALRDIESEFEASVVRQAHSFALGSASASLTPALYSTERTQGIAFWYRVKEMLEDGNLPVFVKGTAMKTLVSERAILHITTDSSFSEEAEREAFRFLSSLEKGFPSSPSTKTVEEREKRDKGYSFPSPVSYAAMAGKAPDERTRENAALRMLLSIVGRNSVWTLIREKGGAYGAGAGLDINEDIWYFYTYRDPRLDSSINDFYKAVAEEEITKEKIEDSKLKILGRDVRPMGPQAKGLLDARRYLYSVTDDLRRYLKESQLSLEKEDLEKAKEPLLAMMKERSVTVLSSSSALSSSSLDLEIRSLPFAP